MLRIAIQSQGRMHQECLELLDKIGVELTVNESKPALVRSSNFPAEVFFVEKERITEYVMNKIADVGIVGEYMARSYNIPEELIVKKLGFDKCTLSLAVPSDVKYKGLEWFANKTVATPYPELVAKYFKNKNIKNTIRFISSSVAAAPRVGIADAVCDRVRSGTALMSENLRNVETLMVSEAVLIAAHNLPPQKKMILDEFIVRFDSVANALGKKFVYMHVPKKNLQGVLDIITALKRPMISTAADEDWVGISTVMDETRLWDILEKLKMYDVENIVVNAIEKIID